MIFEERFQGQVAIVTGGGSGIGLGIGKRIAQEGGAVILAGINEAALAHAKSALRDLPGAVDTMRINITKETDVRRLVQFAEDRYSRLDVVVNGAGIVGMTATNIIEYDLASFRNVLDVNLTGSFLITNYV